MNAEIIAEKIESGIKLGNGETAECQVFDIGDGEVFKLFHSNYTLEEIETSIQLNKEYAKRGFAPQVLSGVIEIDGCYGYITERIEPLSQQEVENDYVVETIELADELGIADGDEDELYHNCGLTKNGDFVLFDWGTFSLQIMGLIEWTLNLN